MPLCAALAMTFLEESFESRQKSISDDGRSYYPVGANHIWGLLRF